MRQRADLTYLQKHCTTDRQREVLAAVIEHGGIRAAARSLGVAYNAVHQSVQAMKTRASMAGEGDHFQAHESLPSPLTLKGTTTLYKDGVQQLQWVKSTVHAEQREAAIREALEAMAADLPRLPPIQAPDRCVNSLLNVYTMTDCHIGMLAWREEGGEDWDLKIAERVLTGCFERMVTQSPDATTCIIAQLGDWLHYDSLMAVTPTSGHILDADGRFAKMVRVGIRVLRRLVDLALMKHEHVILLPAEGNHDIASSVWLRCMFAALYEREPRVTVIQGESPYYAHQHGKTMLTWHHGHLKRPADLPLLAAAQFPVIWGGTTKRYGHLGDKHHLEEKEHSGMQVIQHPTLAARDAYASRHGWHALRSARSITYHDVWGEVGRVIVSPEMVQGVAEAA